MLHFLQRGLIAELIESLLEQKELRLRTSDIGVITPFRRQVGQTTCLPLASTRVFASPGVEASSAAAIQTTWRDQSRISRWSAAPLCSLALVHIAGTQISKGKNPKSSSFQQVNLLEAHIAHRSSCASPFAVISRSRAFMRPEGPHFDQKTSLYSSTVPLGILRSDQRAVHLHLRMLSAIACVAYRSEKRFNVALSRAMALTVVGEQSASACLFNVSACRCCSTSSQLVIPMCCGTILTGARFSTTRSKTAPTQVSVSALLCVCPPR